jgi:hypothetical protein
MCRFVYYACIYRSIHTYTNAEAFTYIHLHNTIRNVSCLLMVVVFVVKVTVEMYVCMLFTTGLHDVSYKDKLLSPTLESFNIYIYIYIPVYIYICILYVYIYTHTYPTISSPEKIACIMRLGILQRYSQCRHFNCEGCSFLHTYTYRYAQTMNSFSGYTVHMDVCIHT